LVPVVGQSEAPHVLVDAVALWLVGGSGAVIRALLDVEDEVVEEGVPAPCDVHADASEAAEDGRALYEHALREDRVYTQDRRPWEGRPVDADIEHRAVDDQIRAVDFERRLEAEPVVVRRDGVADRYRRSGGGVLGRHDAGAQQRTGRLRVEAEERPLADAENADAGPPERRSVELDVDADDQPGA